MRWRRQQSHRRLEDLVVALVAEFSWFPFNHPVWLFEVLSCLISIVALIGIVILLQRYDQQPAPQWPLGITLNTVLAFLTTVSKAAFAYPVLVALSQMKWNWYATQKRPLSDFEAFDEASRGSLGSIKLLIATKGRLSSIIAATILLSSTVTSTITQAVVTSTNRYAPVADGVATIERFTSLANCWFDTLLQVTCTGY
ncbi:hypothetical protein VTN77DRAFT_3149 [Rasamsonia byssochlamydoides]|uniref:uncharacterized protein n=1 Tax=Rasamsonia byssochlamydoides TaxID=89139 RepID=UPI0037439DA7